MVEFACSQGALPGAFVEKGIDVRNDQVIYARPLQWTMFLVQDNCLWRINFQIPS